MWDLIGALIPYLHFFLEIKILSFRKKLQVLDQVHFKKKLQQLDQPTLVIFSTFFENDWIKCKLSKSQIKWTGLSSAGG